MNPDHFLMLAAVATLVIVVVLLPDLRPDRVLGILVIARVVTDGRYNVQIGPLAATEVLGLLIAAVGAAYIIRIRPGSLVAVSAVILLFVSNLRATGSYGSDTTNEVVRMASEFALYVAVVNQTGASWAPAIRLVRLAAVVSAAVSVLQVATGQGEVIDGAMRYAGTMAHPNSAALAYALGAVGSLALYLHDGKQRREVLFLLLLLAGSLATGSIAGIGTLASALLVFTWFDGGLPATIRTRVMGVALFVAAVFVASPVGRSRLEAFSSIDWGGQYGETNSLEWRFGRWRELLSYVRLDPVLGQGYGSSSHGAMLSGYPPHNEYLRLLVETGILGLTLIAIFLLVLTKRLVMARRNESSRVPATIALTALLALLLNALTENTFLYSVPGYMFAIYAATALRWGPVTAERSADDFSTYARARR